MAGDKPSLTDAVLGTKVFALVRDNKPLLLPLPVSR
jgi:hypothetical protein